MGTGRIRWLALKSSLSPQHPVSQEENLRTLQINSWASVWQPYREDGPGPGAWVPTALPAQRLREHISVAASALGLPAGNTKGECGWVYGRFYRARSWSQLAIPTNTHLCLQMLNSPGTEHPSYLSTTLGDMQLVGGLEGQFYIAGVDCCCYRKNRH